VPTSDYFPITYDLRLISDRCSTDARYTDADFDVIAKTQGLQEIEAATDPGPAQTRPLAFADQ
jgi:hypothetical protein